MGQRPRLLEYGFEFQRAAPGGHLPEARSSASHRVENDAFSIRGPHRSANAFVIEREPPQVAPSHVYAVKSRDTKRALPGKHHRLLIGRYGRAEIPQLLRLG